MKTLVYCTVFLWCLFIPLGVVCADDSYEIHDIFHKQKYTITIQDVPEKAEVIMNLLENKNVLDSKEVLNVQGIKKSETLAETFLALTFPIRGGTGIGRYITKIFTVKGGKLFESLILETTYREDQNFGGKTVVERYTVLFNLQGSSYKDFALRVSESEYLDDKMEDPPRHEDWKEAFIIPFNPEEMIFTNGKATLNGEFIFVFFKDKIQQEKHQFKNKTVKKLKLKRQEFLFIDKKWYEVGRDNYLLRK